MSERINGTCKWFDDKKGYGFLISADGEEAFVYHRSIDPGTEGYKTLKEGEQVEFVRVRSEKGWQAHEVTLVESEPA